MTPRHLTQFDALASLGSDMLAQLSVLIVAKTTHTVNLTRSILTTLGVPQIYTANTGEEALRILADYAVDIAFIDELEPPLDGLSVVRKVRTAHAHLPNAVPIIYLTTQRERSAIVAARDAGVTEILSKPFSTSHLVTRLEAAIKKPRQIVQSIDFVGPDRRRRSPDGAAARGRREQDKAE
jgi:two-component system chemotaxis response regulator CheY